MFICMYASVQEFGGEVTKLTLFGGFVNALKVTRGFINLPLYGGLTKPLEAPIGFA